MAWIINQKTGIGRNTETGKTMAIQAPNPRVNPDGTPIASPSGKTSTPSTARIEDLNTSPLGNGGVNSLFKLYYGRNATLDELNYWSTKSDADLRPKLIPNSARELSKVKRDKEVEKRSDKEVAQEEENSTLNTENERKSAEIEAYISGLDIPAEQKQILRQLSSDTFKSDQKIFNESEISSMLDTAFTNAQTNLDPSFAKQSAREIEDTKNKLADIRSKASLYAQQEGKSYKELLDDTKKNLRARGLTFSGIGRKTLGGQSAVGAGATAGSAGVEGEIPQQRRFDYERQLQSFNEQNRDIGIAAERSLGSRGLEEAGLSGTQFIAPYSGNSIQYQTGLTRDQYLAKKAPGGVPQEGFIRSGTLTGPGGTLSRTGQEQFRNPDGTIATSTDANYRFLSDTELARQAAIAKQTAANLKALTSSNSTK